MLSQYSSERQDSEKVLDLWQLLPWLSCRKTLVLEEFWVCYGSKESTLVQFVFALYPRLLTFTSPTEVRKIGQRWSDSIIVSLVTRLPAYASEFIEMCLMITADHGPGKCHAVAHCECHSTKGQLSNYNVLSRFFLKVVVTHSQGQKHSPKKTCFVERLRFSISNIDISTLSPFQCCNRVTVSTERIATLKRGRGGVCLSTKRCYLKLRKDADRKRLFCSNVSTLLS